MARFSKPDLLRVVEDAIRESGWNFLHLALGAQGHPASYQIYRNGESHRVLVYIWNLTHGGGQARPADEYRIQITGIEGPGGVQQFRPDIGAKTLILGWWDDFGVFAGFDYTRHDGPLGSSPSIQIGESALKKAAVNGFAPHNKGNGELAIAFRPDFMATYIENLESLHGCGSSEQEIGLLDEIGEAPEEVTETEIAEGVAEPRRYAVVASKRALRDISFRDRVLTAYSHQCAMCGTQLRLVDAAHILPVAHPESTDQTPNGVALCVLHHRAYDRGFVTFDTKYRVHRHEGMTDDLKVRNLHGGLDRFRDHLQLNLSLPRETNLRPDPAFIKTANGMRGWLF